MRASQHCRYSVAIMVDTEGSEVHTATRTPVRAEVGPDLALWHSGLAVVLLSTTQCGFVQYKWVADFCVL